MRLPTSVVIRTCTSIEYTETRDQTVLRPRERRLIAWKGLQRRDEDPKRTKL